MKKSGIRPMALFQFVLFFMIGAALAGEKMTGDLQRELAGKGSAEPVAAWIFFTDKGPDAVRKIQLTEQTLLPHARQRRLRNRPANRLTDIHDVPVYRVYLRRITGEGVRLRHKSRWLNAVSVDATADQLRRIESLSFVRKIDVVHRFRGPEVPPERPVEGRLVPQAESTYSLSYGSSLTQNQLIHTPELHDLGYDGSGVIICMLDAGFNNLQHDALAPIQILHTWDFVNGDSVVSDEPGQMGSGTHGTYTLGTIAGYAPGHLIGPAFGASFLLAKTENTDYEQHIEEDHWVAGAEWADSLGADIISSSLGYRDFDPGVPSYTWQDMDGNTAIVTIGADMAASRGILVVNSAGNEGSSSPTNPNTLVAPADGDSVLAAGAVDGSGQRVYFSSMGPTADGRIKPDVMAMGAGVTAPSTGSASGYTSVDGTSFSCPLTAGAAALILQANPYISNMDIVEALRQTASRAASPDNQYGWGIVNAYAAAFYFRPKIDHTPLTDSEDVNGPYPVDAVITSHISLNPDSLKVFYRYDSGAFQSVLLLPQGGDLYRAQIPGPGGDADIGYYIRAVTDSGTFATAPEQAPAQLYNFHVGADVTPPVIGHNPLQQVPYRSWPAAVHAVISDNLGINDNEVYVEWRLNGTPQPNFALIRQSGDLFSGRFNSDTTQIQVGDTVAYRIHAADVAAVPNISYAPASGFYSFVIMQTRGLVLLIDDESSSRGVHESRGRQVDYQPESGRSASAEMAAFLNQLGYLVTVETPASSNPATWTQYNVVISSSGENPAPVADAAYRQALVQFAQNGGKILVEGGEVGYDAVTGNSYSDFAANVLHVTDWNGDNEGPLQRLSAFNEHPIASAPNLLPASISLTYNSSYGWYDQDAMTPDNQSYVVYQPQNEPGNAGILVYDDNANPASAQIVYWAFDFSSVSDTAVARDLLENSLTYLMADETPTGITGGGSLARTLRLYPNYPNPFNPATAVRFQLPWEMKVEVLVYNSLGQQVAVLAKGRMAAGLHRLSWNASGNASGVYYLVLRAGQQRQVRKMVLMK